MTKPTAEEALEWLCRTRSGIHETKEGRWRVEVPLSRDHVRLRFGDTPLEAIRNAMKGESGD